jgi:hypothetical protein
MNLKVGDHHQGGEPVSSTLLRSSFFLSLSSYIPHSPSILELHLSLNRRPAVIFGASYRLPSVIAMTSSTAQMLAEIESGTALQVGLVITWPPSI